jgi:hypothetical protein
MLKDGYTNFVQIVNCNPLSIKDDAKNKLTKLHMAQASMATNLVTFFDPLLV